MAIALTYTRKELEQLGWQTKIIRLRPDYFSVCSYLDFLAHSRATGKYEFFDDLFQYALMYLGEHSGNYRIEDYRPLRKGKGFFVSPTTFTLYETTYETLRQAFTMKGHRLLKAEFTELLIYIYVTHQLSLSERTLLNVNWGIHKAD